MAVTMIRSSYALRPESVADLDALAKKWRVSKSEALRRAIAIAKLTELADGPAAALQQLRQLPQLADSDADDWAADVRKQRRASRR